MWLITVTHSLYNFEFYGSEDAQTMFGRGSGYYYDVS